MDVTDRVAGRERRPALAVRQPVAGLKSLSLLLLVWGLLNVTSLAGDILILGQSPVGPLLEEEPGSWLDDVRPAEPLPGSIVGEDFGPSTGTMFSAGAFQEGIPAGDGVGESVHCPNCGGSFSVACPTCSPVAEGAFFPAELAGPSCMGVSGPTGKLHDLLQPMTTESWLYRPLSAGWFMGFMQGNELVEDWVGQEQGFFGGYRFGWDYDPYWGCEMRFGFASVALQDSARAKAAQEAADLAAGLTPDDPYFHRFDTRRDSGIRLWDVDMLWYPFGDTYLRPYFLIGLGSARVDFMDRLSERRIKSVLAMPIAIGFKYRLRDWLAVRVEATDNFIAGAGSGFKNLHNFSLTAGLEVRFGGTRTAYWPYYPGRHYW